MSPVPFIPLDPADPAGAHACQVRKSRIQVSVQNPFIIYFINFWSKILRSGSELTSAPLFEFLGQRAATLLEFYHKKLFLQICFCKRKEERYII